MIVVGERLGEDKLVVLADGGHPHDVALAAKTLQTLTPLFSKSDPPGALVTGLSFATCVQLAHTYGESWKPQPRLVEWLQDQVIARTATDSQLLYTAPVGMTPYEWQSSGAAMIAAVSRALITDEPGTGKTATAILGLCERYTRDRTDGGPIVIVCPASVVDNWVREWAMWAPHVKAVAWRGPKRTALAGTADVYVTSYDTARMDATEVPSMSPLLKLGAESLVIDECHFIKNATAARTKAVIRLAKAAQRAGGAVVALSGTPITRDTADLHPALQALDEHAWASKERFIKRYCLTIQGDYDEQILGLEPYREAEFRQTLLGQHRRVAKADVLADLPPKVYTKRTVDLPAKWRKVYDDFEASMYAELPDGTELSVLDAMSMYTHLSALSSAPGKVEVTYGPDEDKETGELKRHVHIELDPFDPKSPTKSWKVAALMELLEERRGRQTIVCAPSRQLMDIAGAAAVKAGYRVGYVVGGQSAGARTADIDAFQAGQLDAIFVTTQAGGVGITLTAADAVVFLQRPWALDESIQMEDRCFGAGTPVLTPDGWLPIDDLKPGSVVITHTGAQRTVIDAWSQESKQMMADVSITGQEPVTCTADHRFMLADGSWLEAGSLRPGDWLALPGNDVTDELTEMAFEGHRLPQKFRGRVTRAPQTIAATDDFLYTLGYYAGDGFASVVSGKGRFISFAGNDTNKVGPLERCKRWAESQGMTVGRSDRSPSIELRAYSAEWAFWFHTAFGGQSGAVHKRLPDFALRLNQRQSQLVLDGLTDSDGYRRHEGARVEYVTVSAVLAGQVALLATRAGHRPSLKRGSKGQHIVAFGGAPGPRNAGRVTSVLLRHPAKPQGRRERVYDITVEQDETFVVGGVVVHNCHRVGADHESIQIIDIVALKTIDQRRRDALRGKVRHLAEIVNDPRLVAELLGGQNVQEHPTTTPRELISA